jgi:hypothetical protein
MTSLSTLPAVGLEEISERAGLMTRVDRKYLVPRETVQELITELDGSIRVLEIGGRRTFRYTSTYYDTADLTTFRAAAGKRRRRAKIRCREYVDSGTAFLEVKTATGRGGSSKQRIPVPAGPDADPASGPLEGPSRAFVDTALDGAGCALDGELGPVLTTHYDRTTLLVTGEESRVTIDAGLRWEIPGTQRPTGTGRHAATAPHPGYDLDGLVVIETKAGTRPGRADRLLWADGHRPVRISKFATGLALLDPRLPGNRWHRTLQKVRSPAATAEVRAA